MVAFRAHPISFRSACMCRWNGACQTGIHSIEALVSPVSRRQVYEIVGIAQLASSYLPRDCQNKSHSRSLRPKLTSFEKNALLTILSEYSVRRISRGNSKNGRAMATNKNVGTSKTHTFPTQICLFARVVHSSMTRIRFARSAPTCIHRQAL